MHYSSLMDNKFLVFILFWRLIISYLCHLVSLEVMHKHECLFAPAKQLWQTCFMSAWLTSSIGDVNSFSTYVIWYLGSLKVIQDFFVNPLPNVTMSKFKYYIELYRWNENKDTFKLKTKCFSFFRSFSVSSRRHSRPLDTSQWAFVI